MTTYHPHMAMPDSTGRITVDLYRFDGQGYTRVDGYTSHHTTHNAAIAAFHALVGIVPKETPQQGQLWQEQSA